MFYSPTVQVICSERPDSLRVEHSSKDDPIDDRVNNVSTVQQIQKQVYRLQSQSSQIIILNFSIVAFHAAALYACGTFYEVAFYVVTF